MSRTRAYTRKMRAKAIKRKKRIVSNWYWFGEHEFYPHDGMFSKNKIHCSCRMCRSKDYNGRHVRTMQEKRHGIGLKYSTLLNEIDAGMAELVDALR